MRKRCSIQQGEKITVDQSKVLKNRLYRLFRFLGATRYRPTCRPTYKVSNHLTSNFLEFHPPPPPPDVVQVSPNLISAYNSAPLSFSYFSLPTFFNGVCRKLVMYACKFSHSFKPLQITSLSQDILKPSLNLYTSTLVCQSFHMIMNSKMQNMFRTYMFKSMHIKVVLDIYMEQWRLIVSGLVHVYTCASRLHGPTPLRTNTPWQRIRLMRLISFMGSGHCLHNSRQNKHDPLCPLGWNAPTDFM